MDISIKEDKNNALLHRRELNFVASYDGATPKRIDVRNKLAAMLNIDSELVVIQSITNMFGKQEASGYAKVYEDADYMKKIESKHILNRNTVPEEAEAGEAGSE
ncbi:Ribosomal protein S24e [Methanosalsum zhilinae DSM 4017]|uniref:Small ribosomal subunit protein eS24 n=1 Tax=Methanosalsum zhilinae (strain DSM 4017 / NBRC 107636 / OCM 62 / WeN5) TaxID=679901 RepID=F7XPT2_METZD|nr:30S ribosomal protein S24e [Methanosalsum zhilinae]AEH60357.1 Ribosomal protein S24e [Methanosalsum zhilinae DSM 4017]